MSDDMGSTVGLWEENIGAETLSEIEYKNALKKYGLKERLSWQPPSDGWNVFPHYSKDWTNPRVKLTKKPMIAMQHDSHEYAFYSHKAKEKQKEAEKDLVKSQTEALESYRKALGYA